MQELLALSANVESLKPPLLQGNPVPMVYFAVECVDQPVPQLQYVPIANVTSEWDKLLGFHPYTYELPDVPKYVAFTYTSERTYLLRSSSSLLHWQCNGERMTLATGCSV